MALSKINSASILDASVAATDLASGAARDNFGANAILQIQTTVLNGFISTSVGGSPDVITNGAQVFGINFTPVSATSKILVQTSTIAVSEESNAGDMCWVALWNGSSFIAANSGTWLYTHFGGNLAGNYHTVHELFNSGSTTTRLIQVRAGMNTGTAYINGSSFYNYNSINAQVRMTIMEIAG